MLISLQHCLAPLGCLLAYLLTYLLDDLTIILFDDCEEFETFTYTVFQNHIIFQYLYRSSVSVPFSCICNDLLYRYYFSICTNPQYRYYFPILWYSIVISTVFITWHAITCYVDHMAPDMLLVDTCPILWYHLSPVICHINTWPVIITFTWILYLLSYIIYSDIYP